MDLVVVIVAYWPDRYVNINEQLVDLLERSSVKPDKVIVFNNNPERTLPATLNAWKRRGVSLIESSGNFTSRSKYAIAMLEPAQSYLLLDDDVSVGVDTIKGYQKYATAQTALCEWGIKMTETNYYSGGEEIKGHEINEPVKVDGFFGRIQYLSFASIVRMFEAEMRCRLADLPLFRSVGEDILIALCNPHAYVVPVGDNEWPHHPVVLGTHAMMDDPGYMELRNLFAYRSKIRLGLPTSGLSGGPGNRYEMESIRKYIQILERRG